MLTYRLATYADADLFFHWANESSTRNNSYNHEQISYEDHIKWFNKRVNNPDVCMFIFYDKQETAIGQVRIEKELKKQECLIGISVSETQRGKGYSSEMIHKASLEFIFRNPGFSILAYVFLSNQASFKSFLKAGYQLVEEREINGIPSYILKYN